MSLSNTSQYSLLLIIFSQFQNTNTSFSCHMFGRSSARWPFLNMFEGFLLVYLFVYSRRFSAAAFTWEYVLFCFAPWNNCIFVCIFVVKPERFVSPLIHWFLSSVRLLFFFFVSDHFLLISVSQLINLLSALIIAHDVCFCFSYKYVPTQFVPELFHTVKMIKIHKGCERLCCFLVCSHLKVFFYAHWAFINRFLFNMCMNIKLLSIDMKSFTIFNQIVAF